MGKGFRVGNMSSVSRRLYVLPRREDTDSLFVDIHYLPKGVIWSTTILGKTHDEIVCNIVKFVRWELKEDKIKFLVKFVSPSEIEKLLKNRRRNEVKKILKKMIDCLTNGSYDVDWSAIGDGYTWHLRPNGTKPQLTKIYSINEQYG